MFFSDDDLHDAMRTSLETLMHISVSCEDIVQRGNAAIALANLVFGVWDRQQDRDIDAEALYEDDEDDGDSA